MANGRTRDLEGMLVALVGGSGFFGTHLAQELLSRGARLRVCSRHPERSFKLRPLGSLGQIQFVATDVTKPRTVAAALTGVDAVVNLVGAFAGDLDSLQGQGVGRVAEAAGTAGAKAFVHVSALGADAGSDVPYARTKAEGEQAALAAFPTATIVRPSILFGEDDNFLNMFGGLMAKLPVLPVFGPLPGCSRCSSTMLPKPSAMPWPTQARTAARLTSWPAPKSSPWANSTAASPRLRIVRRCWSNCRMQCREPSLR
ncbi:NAD(P)H-binding protein [Novosphingobium sp. THN1]|uniref:NAD(P)H-binding protein n=1 Tax=Novosphingobium sp. THN1 TaxID=1016987 RepID=UPI003516F15F